MRIEKLPSITKNNITKAFEYFLLVLFAITLTSIAIISVKLVIYMPDFSKSITVQEETLQAVERIEIALYQNNQSNEYQSPNITQQIEIYTSDYELDDEDGPEKAHEHKKRPKNERD